MALRALHKTKESALEVLNTQLLQTLPDRARGGPRNRGPVAGSRDRSGTVAPLRKAELLTTCVGQDNTPPGGALVVAREQPCARHSAWPRSATNRSNPRTSKSAGSVMDTSCPYNAVGRHCG